MARESKAIVEAYLVAQARLGDAGAQDHLVARYQPKLLRHAYRLLGDADPARDAVQESWLEIFRGLSNLKDDGSFAVWAFRIVSRRCARQIARLQKRRTVLAAVSADIATHHSPEDKAELAADRRPLRDAMAKLPAEHRAAIALFYLEEMSVAEVAVALEIPVGTVKSRLMHARQKLRAVLEGGDDGSARQNDQRNTG